MSQIINIRQTVPLVALSRLSEILKIDLRIMRDDLYPMLGGSCKARKMQGIVDEMEGRGVHALVTSGEMTSSHVAMAAMAAAAKGWRCKIILQRDSAHESTSISPLLMQLCGPDIEIVKRTQVQEAIEKAVWKMDSEGCKVAVIPASGGMAGAAAYMNAMDDLAMQCQAGNWTPDLVITANGTGATQAGMLAGLDRLGWATEVVGVLAGGQNPFAAEDTKEIYAALRDKENIQGPVRKVDVRQDWSTFANDDARKQALMAMGMVGGMEGIVLDPVYTATAFAALLSMVRGGEITPGAKVVFWHTGGLISLMNGSAAELAAQAANRLAKPCVDILVAEPQAKGLFSGRNAWPECFATPKEEMVGHGPTLRNTVLMREGTPAYDPRLDGVWADPELCEAGKER